MMETSSPFSSPTEFLFHLNSSNSGSIIESPQNQMMMSEESQNVLTSSSSIYDQISSNCLPKSEKYSTRFRKVQSQGYGDVKSGHVANKKCATKHVFRHSTMKASKSKTYKYDPHANIKLIAGIKKKMAFADNLDEVTKFSCSLKDS